MTDEAEATAESSARTQPESLRLKALSAGLTVNDLTESTRWYCDVVGFTLEENSETVARLHEYLRQQAVSP